MKLKKAKDIPVEAGMHLLKSAIERIEERGLRSPYVTDENQEDFTALEVGVTILRDMTNLLIKAGAIEPPSKKESKRAVAPKGLQRK